MPQGYENTSGAYVPAHVPDPGSILVIRNNTIILDFAETADTQAEYGTALTTALQAMQAGDTLVTGPGQFTVEEATFTANDALWIGHGTILSPATNWNYVVSVTGSNVSIDNVKIQCNSLANTGEGVAWTVTGDRCRLTNCEGSGTNGSTPTPWGVEVFGDDCRLDNFLSKDAGTHNGTGGGIRVAGDRCHISNSQVLDSANRSLNIEASGTHESLVVNNCQFVAQGTGNAQINFNPSGTIRLAVFENVTVANIDNVAPGVSYDSTSRQQMLKFQNVDNLILDGCRFVHGSNQGTGGKSPTLSYDAGIPKLTIRDCFLSDGITVGAGKFGTVLIDNCDIGQDSGATSSYSSLIRRMDADHMLIRNNTFHLPATVVSEVIEFSEAALQPDISDQYIIVDNTFTANDATTHRLARDAELKTTPRRIICAGNEYENLGTGSFVPSSDNEVALMLTTDRDGNLLFDDSAIGSGMPTPGAGPTYFTAVPGTFTGQRIINVNWTPDGTQVTPEQSWIWDGINWREYTGAGSSLDVDKGDGNLSGTVVVDFSKVNHHTGTLTGDISNLTFTLPTRPQFLVWILTQNGNNGYTVDFSNLPLMAGGTVPRVNTGNLGVTVMQFYTDGSNLYQVAPWA